MAIKTSTGLRNQMLDTNPLKTVFNLGFLKIYDSSVHCVCELYRHRHHIRVDRIRGYDRQELR
jgi:hypothetical protein